MAKLSLAIRLEDFRKRHWMHWASQADHDLIREAIKAAENATPQDVLDAAHSFVADGYRGPLNWAKKVFDWVASRGPRSGS